MKINFWQTLGAILLVLGLAGIIYREVLAPAGKPKQPSPATQPATLPVAAVVLL